MRRAIRVEELSDEELEAISLPQDHSEAGRMNKIDTLTWGDEFSQGFKVFEYRGKTLRIWLFGLFFQIGFGWRV